MTATAKGFTITLTDEEMEEVRKALASRTANLGGRDGREPRRREKICWAIEERLFNMVTKDSRVPAEMIRDADGEAMEDAMVRAGMRFGVKPLEADCSGCGHSQALHDFLDPKRPIDLSCSYHDNEGPCMCGGMRP